MTGIILILILLFLALIYVLFFNKPKIINKIYQIDNRVCLEVKVIKPTIDQRADIQSDPLAAEQLFSVLHGILKEGIDTSLFSFEILATDEKIRFIVVTPELLVQHISAQIYAQYGNAQINRIEDYTPRIASSPYIKACSLVLGKDTNIPISTFRNFEIDPLSAITSSLSQVKMGQGVSIQIVTKPKTNSWQIKGYDLVAKIKKKDTTKSVPLYQMFIFGLFEVLIVYPIKYILGIQKPPEPAKSKEPTALSQSEESTIKDIENKLTRMGFDAYIRVVSFTDSQYECEQNFNSCVATFKQFSRANLNEFVEIPEKNIQSFNEDFINRRLYSETAYILNTEELASIYHLPSSSVDNPNIAWAPVRNVEIPDNLPTSDCVILGKTNFRGKEIQFGMKDGSDRLRHMYMIGKTGSGKTSLFLSMIIQDILKGNGVGVLDPHGDLIRDILQYIPEERIKDVILIDPSDYERPVGINVLELDDPMLIDKEASNLKGAFQTIFKDSWGPRLAYILNNCIVAMMAIPGTTILGIKRILIDDDYRKFIISGLQNLTIREFFEKEFAQMKTNSKLATEAISPIQNKIGPFEAIKIVRNILCQKNSTINFRNAMDTKKIVLINLSKGLAGSDVMSLFGSLIISKIQNAALSRANTEESKRVPFYLYIDEFQNFTSDTFMEILSESRKYGLGLYLTNQLIDQLSEEMRAVVLGNVGTVVSYSLGPIDAKFMKDVFVPFTETDIQSLPKFNIITTLMIDGSVTKPFNAEIIRPWETFQKAGNEQKCIEYSRNTYGADRAMVESTVDKWIVKSFKGLRYGDIAPKK